MHYGNNKFALGKTETHPGETIFMDQESMGNRQESVHESSSHQLRGTYNNNGGFQMNDMTHTEAGTYVSPFKLRYDNYIGGAFVPPVNGKYFENGTKNGAPY